MLRNVSRNDLPTPGVVLFLVVCAILGVLFSQQMVGRTGHEHK